MKKLMFLMVVALTVLPAQAARRARGSMAPSESSGPVLTYDLGASAGSYGGFSYSEINLGLNWYLKDWLNWRNAVFSRFGSGESASGWDTSLRFEYRDMGDHFGLHAFAGPGYRLASKALSAAFVEGGLIFKLGGLHLGVGAKAMSYANPGQDANGATLPKNDTTYFIILGGGGVL